MAAVSVDTFAPWRGTRVGVIGARVIGEAVSRVLLDAGVFVRVFEDRPEACADRIARLRALGAEVVAPEDIGGDVVNDLAAICPSPGVPPTHPVLVRALSAGIPIVSELDFAERARGDRLLIAVTGTNGKTTVTQLIESVLQQGGIAARACGNFGEPFITAVSEASVEVFVVEVSSFQLEYVQQLAPHIAVLTNLADDHLDWHGSRDHYFAAKRKVFTSLPADGVLICDTGDTHVAEVTAREPMNRVGFVVAADCSVHIDHRGIWDPKGVEECLPQGARTPIDVRNWTAAALVGLRLGIAPETIRAALEISERFPHRMEFVGEAMGVQYIDDSKATNPHATLAALEGKQSVILLAGGQNKGIDLSVLRERQSALKAVVAIGDAAPEVAETFQGIVPLSIANSMAMAVTAAMNYAAPGDTIMLSPACASFDWYSGYGARGDDFVAEVRKQAGVTQ